MLRRFPIVIGWACIAGLFVAACGSDDGAERRVILITQTDEGCTPETIDLTAGEKVKFDVKNEGKKDREVEGVDGTKLEEVLVPSGKTRSLKYSAPKSAGSGKIKCYIPGGNTVFITLKVT